MPSRAKSPEPAGLPQQYGRDSWKRDEAKPVLPERAPCTLPAQVTAESARATFGPVRWAAWSQVCKDFKLDLNTYVSAAATQVNKDPDATPAERHLDARGLVRVMISDAIRGALESSTPPNLPRPILY